MQPISRLEQDSRLDGLVSAGQRIARLIKPGRVRDALHGRWPGHPLHPMLVQAPVGTWLSASVLDFTGGDERAARRLVMTGLIAALPAAVAGAADWSEQHEQQMRVGSSMPRAMSPRWACTGPRCWLAHRGGAGP
jgi:hypothetical protein